MKKKLNQLTTNKTGLVISRKKTSLLSRIKKDYNVISLKSFNESGIYDHSFAENFEANEEIKDEYLLHKGDILIRLRKPNIAVYIDKDYENTIVSSLATILKVTDNQINPLYLVHYLNSSMVKRQLHKEVTASAIPMINLQDINNLIIDIPTKDIQDKLALQQQLGFDEIQLLENLINEKKQYNKAIFNKIAQGNK